MATESTPQANCAAEDANVQRLENFKSVPIGILTVAFISAITVSLWVVVVPIVIATQLATFLPLPIRKMSFWLGGMVAGVFCGSVIGFIELVTGLRYICYGDTPPNSSETALLICNHPTEWDWLYLWGWFGRHAYIPDLRIAMKQDVGLLPLFGWSVQACSFLFLTRKWSQDKDNLISLVEYWRVHHNKRRISLLIFPEGTNLTRKSAERGEQYCIQQNMPLLKEVLPPRSTGFFALFMHMTGLAQFVRGDTVDVAGYYAACDASTASPSVASPSLVDAVYDMTIAYGRTRANRQMHIGKCYFPNSVHVHCRRIPLRTFTDTLACDAATRKPDDNKNKRADNSDDSPLAKPLSPSDVVTPTPTTTTATPPSPPSPILAPSAPPPATVSLASLDASAARWLARVFYDKDERLHAFYTSPRIADTLAPPLLDREIVLPCPATKEGRRVALQQSWNPLVEKGMRWELFALAAAFTLIIVYWRQLLSGNALVWTYSAAVIAAGYYWLNVKLVPLPIAFIEAAGMTHISTEAATSGAGATPTATPKPVPEAGVVTQKNKDI